MRRIVLALAVAALAAACGDNSPADPCIAMGCPLPPAPHCTDGATLVVTVPSSCAVTDGQPDCQYSETTVNCAVTGEECGAGACHPPGDPCLSATCETPPADACKDTDTLTTYDTPGVCDGSSGNAICAYASHDTDCTANGQVCHDGACVDACAGTTCDSPPDDQCDESGVLTTYPATGTCDGSTGTGVCTYAPTTTNCHAANQQCDAGAGACVDPCATNPCTAAPADSCGDATHSVHHTSPGVCTSPGGNVACDYSATTTIDCGALDQVCDPSTGACADPCAPNPCTSPDPDTCTDSTHSSHHPNPGACTSPGGVVACDYTPATIDCAAANEDCDAGTGACADPCIGFTCDEPPADTCQDPTHAITHPSGSCSSPGGTPECDYPPAVIDCGANNQACSNGACVDPCVGMTCETPPAASCTGIDTARTFASSGTCSSPGGVAQCDYPPTDTDCELSGKTCTAGACGGPVMFCRIQSPPSVSDVPGATAQIYSHVFVTGITDKTGGNDPDPSVVVELGTGGGADPSAYSYAPALPNVGYNASSPGYEANNDEYVAPLTVTGTPGTTYHYAYRLSGDSGATWLYCDVGNPGSSDGFTTPGDVNVEGPFFSEYVEGAVTANKAIEIYNPGSIPFAVGGCKVGLFSNGGASAVNTTITALATIAPGDVYVLCKTGIADASQCDQTTGSALWNGNDAISLTCGTTVYDVFGQIGNDPGVNGWGTGSITTTDHTLLRQCNVTAGDTNGSDAFDPAAQWASYPADTVMYLGARNCPLP